MVAFAENKVRQGTRGYRYDAETQNYYVRNRYYLPTLGRWLTRDPIGYQGGINLYEYVQSSPVGNVDAEGLAGGWAHAEEHALGLPSPAPPPQPSTAWVPLAPYKSGGRWVQPWANLDTGATTDQYPYGRKPPQTAVPALPPYLEKMLPCLNLPPFRHRGPGWPLGLKLGVDFNYGAVGNRGAGSVGLNVSAKIPTSIPWLGNPQLDLSGALKVPFPHGTASAGWGAKIPLGALGAGGSTLDISGGSNYQSGGGAWHVKVVLEVSF